MSSTEKYGDYSLSDFLKDFPNKLLWAPPLKSGRRLYVFSGRDEDEDDELEPSKTLSHQRPTKAVMKSFLTELELYLYNPVILVQFWTAKSKGGNWILTTSDQPFGVNIFHGGLASYRSHCVDNNYVISDNEEAEDIGPHVRVFRDKCLELSPDVRYYSVKEYPQQQYAISYGVRGMLALPVFRDMGGPCVGVLEIVTTSGRRSDCYYVGYECSKFKKAGMVCPNIFCNPSVHTFEGTKDEFKQISEALDKVCKALQIPFAQTWVPCPHSVCWASGSSERKSYTSFDGGDSGYMLTTIKAPYSMAARSLYSFRKTIELYHIRKGKGVVGRAFSSHNACFCKDITKLSIIEYPFAHHAYDVGITSSFAISLQSSYTGNIVYILEFFLPLVKIDGEHPRIFLDTLLGTMKQHFHTFRVASGEELGGKLSVEVVKLSMDDELNSFEIEALRDGEETMQLDSPYQQLTVEFSTNSGRNVVGAEQRNSTSYLPTLEACQNGGEIVQPDSSYHKPMAEVDATNSGRNVVSAEQRDSSYRKSISEVDGTSCGRNVVSAEHRAISSHSAVLALQNGGQIVQLDSSYQKNMSEVDASATNNEKKIASADQSNIVENTLLDAEITLLNAAGAVTAISDNEAGPTSTPIIWRQESVPRMTMDDVWREIVEEERERECTDYGGRCVEGERERKERKEGMTLEVFLAKASADQSDIADIPLEKRGPAKGSDREGEISRDVLEKLFGTYIENAASILGVSRSTFKRKCRQHGIKRWPFPKRNRVTHSPSQLESIQGGNKQTGESSRRDWLPCDKAPKHATTSIASTMPHASASVAMKATYGNDIIKFRLPFSSGMLELEEAVAKRLKLKAGSYKIKYEDEDDDWVLVSCDEDLQDCISTWRSLDRSLIKLSILPNTD